MFVPLFCPVSSERLCVQSCAIGSSLLISPPLSQALSLKEAEKAVLSDRVSLLQTELSAAALEVKRLLREAADYKEQEEVRAPRLLCSGVMIAPFKRSSSADNEENN